MSVSDDQLKANRENAQHSTGPRTPDGKAKAALAELATELCGVGKHG